MISSGLRREKSLSSSIFSLTGTAWKPPRMRLATSMTIPGDTRSSPTGAKRPAPTPPFIASNTENGKHYYHYCEATVRNKTNIVLQLIVVSYPTNGYI